MTDERPSLARRAGRYLLDSWALGGLTRGSRRGDQGMYTGPVIHATLDSVAFEEEQSERLRSLWSLAGASLIVVLGVATLAVSWPAQRTLASAVSVGLLVVAALVLLAVVRRTTRDNPAHLVGIVLVAVLLYESILAPPPLFGGWALPVLVAETAAILCLLVGRR